MRRACGKADEHLEGLVPGPVVNSSEEEADKTICVVSERIRRTPVETFEKDVLDRTDQPRRLWQVAQQLVRERRALHALWKLEHQSGRNPWFLELSSPLIQSEGSTERSIAVEAAA